VRKVKKGPLVPTHRERWRVQWIIFLNTNKGVIFKTVETLVRMKKWVSMDEKKDSFQRNSDRMCDKGDEERLWLTEFQ
jgi:hypothetical protein